MTTASPYGPTVRALLRYAVVMLMVALLSGVLFQESSKKLTYADVPPGMHLESVLSLALVHGHVMVTGVLVPIALAAALHLAHAHGGAEIGARTLKWLTRVYLPCAAATLALMLYKGYHVLLAVRSGERDFEAVDATHFGGLVALRHLVYGAAHIGMALGLGVFAVGLWRSLRRA